ncbi:terminase large subunit [Mycobacterium phage Madruga]|uniref:Terminase large subunit n=1 Tax=Mycobacterium phage Madruga TaxID=1675552 RepID=A0A0K1LT25_9CAUD|nr:terminase large subunit [Mycobacterium phage Madruga]
MNKWAVFDSLYPDFDEETGEPTQKPVFDPHSGQLEIMESDARFKIASCGRRFGKSNLGGHELIPEALRARMMATALKSRGQRLEFWIVGPEYVDSEKEFRVFYDKATKLGMEFDRPGTYYSVQTGDMVVSLWDGAFILQAKSEARPSSLVGEALSGVIMAEAAKMKESTWTQLIRPALSDMKGWGLFTTTPEGKNWFYQYYLDAIKQNNPGWAGFRMPSWYNTRVFTGETKDAHVKRLMHLMSEHPEFTAFEIIKSEGLVIDEEIAQMANDLTIPMFQQEVAADFTDFVGKVFKEYDEETHSRLLHYNPSWKTIAAVDYGYRNPNVWLLIQIGPWGEINIIDELYQRDLTPVEFANEILRRGLVPDTCLEFYPDPASPEHSATMETIFLRNGRNCRAKPHTGGELDNRLNLIRFALKDRITDTEMSQPNWRSSPPQKDQKRPRLMISTRCPNTLFEFGEYRYPEAKDEKVETSTKRFELPIKKNDHTPEALGRALAGMYHSTSAQLGGGARISTARFFNSLAKIRDRHEGGYGLAPAGIPTRRTSRSYGTWGSTR